MREEISNGMAEIEGRILQNMTVTMDTLKAELRAEAAAREQLEARLATLEQQYASGGTHVREDERVDKSIAVIGDESLEEAEKNLKELLASVDGFKELSMSQGQVPLGFAHFESSAHALCSRHPCGQPKTKPYREVPFQSSQQTQKVLD